MSDTPRLHHFTSSRQQLSCAEWGEAGAPPLILLHGAMDHGRSWDWLAARLPGFHIFAPDLLGHGDSSWASGGRYRMPDFVYDLAALFRHLGLEQAAIVGHSLGGNIALRYAGIFPETVTAVVSIEGLGPSPDVLRQYAARAPATRAREAITARMEARPPRRYPTLAAAARSLKARQPFLSTAEATHLARHGTRRQADGSYCWKFDPLLRLISTPEGDQGEVNRLFGRIRAPVLLLYGGRSWASNPQKDGRLALFGPNARLLLFEEAGHFPQRQEKERFLATLKGFLSSPAAAGPAAYGAHRRQTSAP